MELALSEEDFDGALLFLFRLGDMTLFEEQRAKRVRFVLARPLQPRYDTARTEPRG